MSKAVRRIQDIVVGSVISFVVFTSMEATGVNESIEKAVNQFFDVPVEERE